MGQLSKRTNAFRQNNALKDALSRATLIEIAPPKGVINQQHLLCFASQKDRNVAGHELRKLFPGTIQNEDLSINTDAEEPIYTITIRNTELADLLSRPNVLQEGHVLDANRKSGGLRTSGGPLGPWTRQMISRAATPSPGTDSHTL